MLTSRTVYPNLGKTRLVGYDGIAPGPTFMMRKGTEAVVRFINHADRANSVHLHGSYCKHKCPVPLIWPHD
jgi:bilirubin oxidase